MPAISQQLAAQIAGCVTASFMGALLCMFLYYFFFKRGKLVVRHPGAVRDMIHPHRVSEGKRSPSKESTTSTSSSSSSSVPPPSEPEKKWVGYMSTAKSSSLSGVNPLVNGKVSQDLDKQLEVL
jgi:hypothetical protein